MINLLKKTLLPSMIGKDDAAHQKLCGEEKMTVAWWFEAQALIMSNEDCVNSAIKSMKRACLFLPFLRQNEF